MFNFYKFNQQFLKETPAIIHYSGDSGKLGDLPKESREWIGRGINTSDLTFEASTQKPLRSFSLISKNDMPYYLRGLDLNVTKPISDLHKKSHSINRRPSLRASDIVSPNSKKQFVANGLFYIKVLQIVNKSSSKPYDIRCEIKLDNQKKVTSTALSAKCGKNCTVSNFNETFIYDVEGPFQFTISAWAQPRQSKWEARLSRFTMRSHVQPSEVSFGKFEMEFYQVWPMDKMVRRVPLKNWPPSDNGKINSEAVISIGIHVDGKTMLEIEKKKFYEGFLTVYCRGKLTPKWRRYWAVVKGPELLFYDFEYKEIRPPIATLPLHHFLGLSHPYRDEEEQCIIVGHLGLALHFHPWAVELHDSEEYKTFNEADFECKIYILPDDEYSLKHWEDAFLCVAKVMSEHRDAQVKKSATEEVLKNSTLPTGPGYLGRSYRLEKLGNSIRRDQKNQNDIGIPLRYLW